MIDSIVREVVQRLHAQFDIESASAANLPPRTRHAQQQSRPLMDELHAWPTIQPANCWAATLRPGDGYMLRRCEAFTRFLTMGASV